MSASEYPGAEQDAQRLIDQFDALVLDGGRRPQDIASLDDVSRDGDGENKRFGDNDTQEAVARLSSALLGRPAPDRRDMVTDREGEPRGVRVAGRSATAATGSLIRDPWSELDEDAHNSTSWIDSANGDMEDVDDLDRLFDVSASEADTRRGSDMRQWFNAPTGDYGTDGGAMSNRGTDVLPYYARGDEDDDDAAAEIENGDDLDRVEGVSHYGGIEYDDIDWGDVPSERERARDGRPPLARHATDAHARSSPRVIHIARGIVDDGYTVLAIDEHRLAPGGTSAYTNLNGEAYATADLVAYLYAEEPADKSVPHTRQRLTQAQVNGLLALMAAGHAHLMAPADVDGAAYALSRPLSSPNDALSHEAAATIDAHLETALVDEERAVDLAAYHAAALVHYAIEIAMAIGWDYKPAVNFAIARYISAAGTPLLAEEGGLLPDEIPRRRHAHRRGPSAGARNARRPVDPCDDRDDTYGGDLDINEYDDLPYARSSGGDDDDDTMEEDNEMKREDDVRGRRGGVVAIPAETRDEAVARHRALADRRRRHPPMGMDLELVAAVLQAEADDGGLERSPANLDEMRRRLRAAVGTRLKPSKADRKIDRYAVPWAYGVCCALDRRDVDEVLASPTGAAAVAERVNRAWAAQNAAAGGLDDETTASGRKPPRPLAPYLSDAEFAQRLARLEPSLLAALSRVIPLEARGRSDLDAGDYIIYESNLALGAPLSPPMAHSLAQKVMRFARRAGTTPRACDLGPKPPAIVFVRDCPQPAAQTQIQ